MQGRGRRSARRTSREGAVGEQVSLFDAPPTVAPVAGRARGHSRTPDVPAVLVDEPAAVIASASTTALETRVIRSTKRRKTVGAKLVGGVVEVSIPSWMSKREEEKWVEEMRARFA